MKVIFAQGNPGPDYVATRHNVGWRFADAYAAQYGVEFSAKTKFRAAIAEFTINGEKHLLVKPTTFYNESGVAARALADFYKLSPTDFLIVYDELALPLGTLRTRYGGSDAGNNGIKSLNAHLGIETARLRIGIYDVDSPHQAIGRVLGSFTSREIEILKTLEPSVFEIFDEFLQDNFTTTTKKITPQSEDSGDE